MQRNHETNDNTAIIIPRIAQFGKYITEKFRNPEQKPLFVSIFDQFRPIERGAPPRRPASATDRPPRRAHDMRGRTRRAQALRPRGRAVALRSQRGRRRRPCAVAPGLRPMRADRRGAVAVRVVPGRVRPLAPPRFAHLRRAPAALPGLCARSGRPPAPSASAQRRPACAASQCARAGAAGRWHNAGRLGGAGNCCQNIHLCSALCIAGEGSTGGLLIQ